MTIQAWTQMQKEWEQDDIPTVDSLNTVENNLLHLKQKPCEDFDMSGILGRETTTNHPVPMFNAIKRLPARSTMYLKEVSKCTPRPDGQLLYPRLNLGIRTVTYPAWDDLQWNTAVIDPDDIGLRWVGTEDPHTYYEHYYYEDLGLAIVTNPLYVSATLELWGNMASAALAKHNPENTLYMRFHVGYNDI